MSNLTVDPNQKKCRINVHYQKKRRLIKLNKERGKEHGRTTGEYIEKEENHGETAGESDKDDGGEREPKEDA